MTCLSTIGHPAGEHKTTFLGYNAFHCLFSQPFLHFLKFFLSSVSSSLHNLFALYAFQVRSCYLFQGLVAYEGRLMFTWEPYGRQTCQQTLELAKKVFINFQWSILLSTFSQRSISICKMFRQFKMFRNVHKIFKSFRNFQKFPTT